MGEEEEPANEHQRTERGKGLVFEDAVFVSPELSCSSFLSMIPLRPINRALKRAYGLG